MQTREKDSAARNVGVNTFAFCTLAIVQGKRNAADANADIAGTK